MSDAADRAQGWHVGRKADGQDQTGGPYTWDELRAHAASGVVLPDDFVWHESMPQWVTASEMPGLFAAGSPERPASQPIASAAPSYVASAQAAPPVAARRRPGRGWLIAAIAAALVLCLGASALGGFLYFTGGLPGLGGDKGPDMGVAETKLPDDSKLVETGKWGEVPANQVCVMMVDGSRRSDAERVAGAIGGQVVGEIEFVSLYQIEFPGTTEADLIAAIDKVQTAEGVDYAFPNEQVYMDAEIWGVREDPFEDPIYGGGAGDGYDAIGVSKAWSYIRGAGVDLNAVKVGVVDDGLYLPGEGVENEFEGGKVKIEFPDPTAGERPAPEMYGANPNPAGSHGTAVSTVIGANPDNGGPSGVAGPLGDKLTISMINMYDGQYGNVLSAPDPNDPTQYVGANGHTYTDGSLVAITEQVANNAKVINCSWGDSNASPAVVATYQRFFDKMSREHPDVLFVCSGGNSGNVMDGSKRIPSGLKLSNMITVGWLEADGKTSKDADRASGNYEITLGAPGKQVVGIAPKGGAFEQAGSSLSAPQVSAAAAILKSIDPELQAADIKRILSESARTGVPTKSDDPLATSNLIGKEMGGKVLALDEAVLKVINKVRTDKGLKPLTPEMLEQMGVIDAVATTGDPGAYSVKGIVKAAGEKGTDVGIEVWAENSAIGGKTTQHVGGSGGEAHWDVTLPEDKGVIRVSRKDNGGASLITIERIDINGEWSGSFTITNVEITDQEAAEEEGCSVALLDAMKGKPFPMTMDVAVDEGGQGTANTFIDVSSMNSGGGDGDVSSEPQVWGVSYSGTTIEFTPQEAQGISSLSATVSREGETHVMKGNMTGGGAGWRMTAVFTLKQPAK